MHGAEEMPPSGEQRVDHAADGEKALGLRPRFEESHVVDRLRTFRCIDLLRLEESEEFASASSILWIAPTAGLIDSVHSVVFSQNSSAT